MFDLKWIRENADAFERGLKRRGILGKAGDILAKDREWRQWQTQLEQLQSERNRLAKEIGIAKAQGRDAGDIVAQVSESKLRQAALEQQAEELRLELESELAALPNLPADT